MLFVILNLACAPELQDGEWETQELDFTTDSGDTNKFTYSWEALSPSEVKVNNWGWMSLEETDEGFEATAHMNLIKQIVDLTDCDWE